MSTVVHLTVAQSRVAGCIGRGLSYAEAARELGVARDTVRAHVFAIARKITNEHGLPQKAAVYQWTKQEPLRKV